LIAAKHSNRQWLGLSALVYTLIVFVAPIVRRDGWLVWSLTIGSLASFVYLYVELFRHRERNVRRASFMLALMAAIGFAMLPWNVGAGAYIVYAAGLAPLIFDWRRSLALFSALAAAVAVEIALVTRPDRLAIGAWLIALIFVVGVGNLLLGERERQMARLREAREDVEELAKMAERERIARDLHDLLGHTLSVIVLKSELAAKLADRDPARAAAEIREVEHVSREALAEVRAAVEGYKQRGFARELATARQALGSAGVELNVDVAPAPWSPRQEAVLALALREIVTNVLRHARASVCRIALGVADGCVLLTVQDDGVGGVVREGNGLTGMRERVAAAGGVLDVDSAQGVKVSIRFPLHATTKS
jgi:two-component system sensor histidine kinase DesK